MSSRAKDEGWAHIKARWFEVQRNVSLSSNNDLMLTLLNMWYMHDANCIFKEKKEWQI